jgi:NitT/TauT family transport system substrate-binding protein
MLLSAAVVAASFIAGLGSAAAQEKATLRLKWLAQAQFAGFYVAKERNFYRDEGIDLTINPGGPNLQTENLVATGADTFGLSGGIESVLAARDKDLPIVCIGIMHQKTPFAFVVRDKSPIQKLEDLKGKKAATWFTGAHLVFYAMIASKGLQQSDLTIVPQQVSLTPFINGEVDLATVAYYNELHVLRTRGINDLRFFIPDDFGVTLPRDTLIATEKLIRENPKLVQGFMNASLKGWQHAIRNPKEAVDVIMKVSPSLDRAHQEFMMEEVAKLMLAGKAEKQGIGVIDRDAVKYTHDLFLQHKVYAKPIDLAQAIDTRFWDAAPAAIKTK